MESDAVPSASAIISRYAAVVIREPRGQSDGANQLWQTPAVLTACSHLRCKLLDLQPANRNDWSEMRSGGAVSPALEPRGGLQASIAVAALDLPIGGDAADAERRRDGGAVHQPQRNAAPRVVPENVRLAVAVEVAGRSDRPVGGHRARAQGRLERPIA